MTRVLSRTVHVTVSIAVEVDCDEAMTNSDAIEVAKNKFHVVGGNQFDTKEAHVFETWTEEDEQKQKREEFRRKYIL